MKPAYIEKFCHELNSQMYLNLNDFSASHNIIGRLGSIPVALVEVTINTLGVPLTALERMAAFIVNIVGVIFNDDRYSVKDALCCAEFALGAFLHTPIAILMAPIKFTYQFFAILIDPVKVERFHYNLNTFKA